MGAPLSRVRKSARRFCDKNPAIESGNSAKTRWPANASSPAKIRGVLETSLYVEDMDRATQFYVETLGLTVMVADARLVALDCGFGGVLLLFKRGTTKETIRLPSGEIPGHGGEGRLHFALAVDAEDLAAWEARLAERGVAIEGRMTWPLGGKSLYFRDPEANLVELATPGLWKNY